MNRWLAASWIFALFAVASWTGCGPAVSEEDLGVVHQEVPDVPGAEEPYPLPAPEIREPGEMEEEHDHEH